MASSMEVVSMDCEMVGVGPHQESGLARCSLVDINGDVLYDKFIRPEGQITNYRTRVSGITRQHMEQATPFAVARLENSWSGHSSVEDARAAMKLYQISQQIRAR
uniref:Interferon stimulated exonuclease 20 n=1 Tax=Rhinolophus ferrumequinum TaxID=59479 RepID=A0A671EN29_RHIFE